MRPFETSPESDSRPIGSHARPSGTGTPPEAPSSTPEEREGLPAQSESPVVESAGTDGTQPPASTEEKGRAQRRPLGKKKVAIIAAVAACVVIGGGAYAYTSYQAEQERLAEEARIAQENAEIDLFNAYVDTSNSIISTMIGGAAGAETLCNTIQNVWNSAIFEDNQSEWDAEIQKYWTGSDDFNDSLALLFSDPEIMQQQADIQDSIDIAISTMQELSNPPEGCESAYEEIRALYSAFMNLTGLAVSPSGSLQDFRTNFSQYDSECVSAFNLARATVPQKKARIEA